MDSRQRDHFFKAVLAASSAIGLISSLDAAVAQPAANAVAYNIPAQPLTAALTAVAQRSGLRLAYSAALSAGRFAPALQGSFTPVQAIERLLAGTGLTYRFTNANTVTIEGPGATTATGAMPAGAIALDTIDVQGASNPNALIGNLPPVYAGGQVASGGQVGILGARNVMNTPFNQTSYTSKLIQDQQARSIADIAANDPSVRGSWSGSSYTDPLIIRGFATSNQDVALNGMYGVVPLYSVSPEFAERVEILKGPSALLNGLPPQGSIGGSVNIVPKRATDEPITQVTPAFFSRSQVGGHVDIGRRYGSSKEFGVRFNGVYRDGATAVDHQSREVGSSVFGLDYRGEAIRLSADLGYQKQHTQAPVRPTYVAAGLPVPAAPNATNNWAQPWTYVDTAETFGALRGEIDLSPDWTAFAAMGGRYTKAESLYIFTNTITKSAGNITQTTRFLPEEVNSNTQEIGLRGHFATGPVAHGVTLSASRMFSQFANNVANGPAIASNIYSPVIVAPISIARPDARKASEIEYSGLAVSDVLSILDERVQFIAGVRQQYAQSESFSTATGLQTDRYFKSALSPSFGLIVKPWENVSLYGNYIEGLQQGAIVGPAFANAGEIFPPYVSIQKEAGVKVDWGTLTTTISAFEIAQPSVITIIGTPLSSQKLDGELRNRGLEFNSFGQIVETVRVLGGVAFYDAVQVKTANAANDGKTVPGVPRMQLNLGLEWDTPFVPGLTVSGRMIYTSSQYIDAANTQSIPDWQRFDLGARYVFENQGKPITIRFNVQNVLDRNYWATAFSNFPSNHGLNMGVPRTFLLSTTFNF